MYSSVAFSKAMQRVGYAARYPVVLMTWLVSKAMRSLRRLGTWSRKLSPPSLPSARPPARVSSLYLSQNKWYLCLAVLV